MCNCVTPNVELISSKPLWSAQWCPQGCEYVTMHGERDFSDTVKTLEMEIVLTRPGPRIITKVTVRRRQESQLNRRHDSRIRRLLDCKPCDAGSPSRAFQRNMAQPTPSRQPHSTRLQAEWDLCYFKPLCLWSFVTAASGNSYSWYRLLGNVFCWRNTSISLGCVTALGFLGQKWSASLVRDCQPSSTSVWTHCLCPACLRSSCSTCSLS